MARWRATTSTAGWTHPALARHVANPAQRHILGAWHVDASNSLSAAGQDWAFHPRAGEGDAGWPFATHGCGWHRLVLGAPAGPELRLDARDAKSYEAPRASWGRRLIVRRPVRVRSPVGFEPAPSV